MEALIKCIQSICVAEDCKHIKVRTLEQCIHALHVMIPHVTSNNNNNDQLSENHKRELGAACYDAILEMFVLKTASLKERQQRNRLAQSFLELQHNAPPSEEQLSILERLLSAEKTRLRRDMHTRIRIYGAEQFDSHQNGSPHIGVLAPVSPSEAHMLSDEELMPLWSALQAGRKFNGSASYRVVAFGGGLDGPFGLEHAEIPASQPDEEHLLERRPKLILFPGAGKVHFEFFALPEEKRDFIEYINLDLGTSMGMRVPTELSCVTHQQAAVAYYLGNVFGLRGIGVKVSTDRPELALFGGFESSTVYDTLIAEAGVATQLLLARDVMMSAGELFSFVRRSARNELRDYSMGGQGILSTLSDSPTVNYFMRGFQGPSGPLEDTAVFQTELAQSPNADWLTKHMCIINPGIEIKNGKRTQERHAVYTSRMMYSLAKNGHAETCAAIKEMNLNVTRIQSAMLTQDVVSLIEAVNAYTDARITAQATYLRFMMSSSTGALCMKIKEEAKNDDFLDNLLEQARAAIKIEDEPHNHKTLFAFAPFIGGKYPLLQKALDKFQLGVMPMGAGGFGTNWMMFGKPDKLQAFINDMKYSNITSESLTAAKQKSLRQLVLVAGVIKADLDSDSPALSMSPHWTMSVSNGDAKLYSKMKPTWMELDQLTGNITRNFRSGVQGCLNIAQEKAHTDVVNRLQLTAQNAAYLKAQTRQYNTQKGDYQANILFDPENPSVLANIRLTSTLSLQEKRDVRGELPVRATDLAANRSAAQKAELIVMKLLAGVGQRLNRLGFLQMLAQSHGKDCKSVQMATKGLDLGRFVRDEGNAHVFVSIGDMTVRQMISLKKSGEFSSVSFWPVVNTESEPDYQKLLQGHFMSLSRAVDEKVNTVMTRKKALGQAGVNLMKPLVQQAVPPLCVDTGAVDSSLNAKLAPGGTGFCGQSLLQWLLDSPESSKQRVIFLGNGENPGIVTGAMAGHVLNHGWLIAQLEVTTTGFDSSASRCAIKRVDDVYAVDGKPLWVPTIMESREISQLPAADRQRFRSAGLESGFGKVHQQTHNSNCFILNANLISRVLKRLVDICGRSFVNSLLTADFIVRPAVNNVIPVDGAVTTQFHKLNNFLMGLYLHPRYGLTSPQKKRIQKEVPSRALNFLIFDPNERTKIYYINKTVSSAWFFMTDRFTLDLKRGIVSDPVSDFPLPLATVTLKTDDSFFHDVKECLRALGLAQTRHAVSIDILGRSGVILTASNVDITDQTPLSLLEDVIFKNHVIVCNETSDVVNIRHYKQHHILQQIFDEEDRIVLDNIQLRIFYSDNDVTFEILPFQKDSIINKL